MRRIVRRCINEIYRYVYIYTYTYIHIYISCFVSSISDSVPFPSCSRRKSRRRKYGSSSRRTFRFTSSTHLSGFFQDFRNLLISRSLPSIVRFCSPLDVQLVCIVCTFDFVAYASSISEKYSCLCPVVGETALSLVSKTCDTTRREKKSSRNARKHLLCVCVFRACPFLPFCVPQQQTFFSSDLGLNPKLCVS